MNTVNRLTARSTYANIDDFIANHDGSKIRWGFGMDFAERLPYLFHPELVYKLNSKRWLAECDLKSANDEIIDCQIQCLSHQHKSREHRELWYYGGKDCEACTAGVEAEIERVLGLLRKREGKYVLKLTQSLSAVGTNIVEDRLEKAELIEKIAGYLATYLPRITKQNAHLYTTALILSEIIPGETMALNFFVKRDGSVVYLGACHQLATGDSGRQATAITYADQDKLEKKYQTILNKIGKVLHEEGYHGAVGADVMEDKDGNMYTIDLNVRTPLSLVLYLLRGHFNEKRGLGTALVYECVQLKISRDELEKNFAKEFQEARIVLLGGFQMGEKEHYGYGMILAGEDKDKVDQLSDRILEFEI